MKPIHIEGDIISHNDAGFDAAILGTMFNKRDPEQRPDMMVTPRNVDDIIATVRFAKTHGRKVSICSGGHSWSANHVRNGSILINMKGFDTFEIDKDAMTATAGPGVGGSVLLGELFRNGLFFPAGHCKGVCIGGYLLHSSGTSAESSSTTSNTAPATGSSLPPSILNAAPTQALDTQVKPAR